MGENLQTRFDSTKSTSHLPLLSHLFLFCDRGEGDAVEVDGTVRCGVGLGGGGRWVAAPNRTAPTGTSPKEAAGNANRTQPNRNTHA